MLITLQVSLQVKSQLVSVQRLLYFIKANARGKKYSAKCLCTPGNRVGEINVAGSASSKV